MFAGVMCHGETEVDNRIRCDVECALARTATSLVLNVTYINTGTNSVVIDRTGLLHFAVRAFDTRSNELEKTSVEIGIATSNWFKEAYVELTNGSQVTVCWNLAVGFREASLGYEHGGRIHTGVGIQTVGGWRRVRSVKVVFYSRKSQEDLEKGVFGRTSGEVLGRRVFGPSSWFESVDVLVGDDRMEKMSRPTRLVLYFDPTLKRELFERHGLRYVPHIDD